MRQQEPPIGIVSYGIYTPDSFETDREVTARSGLSLREVNDLGIQRKCRPADRDQPVSMAADAAQQAFDRSGGISPGQVDVVIWTGEEYKDYIAQTASIRLQEEVGCKNAWAFDLVAQGVTMIQGLRVARDLIAGDERIDTVLLAGGTRNVDLVDYTNPHTRFLLAASASGGAILVRRGHPQNRLLATAFSVDAEMADEVYVPGGGTQIPFTPDNLNSDLMFFKTPNPSLVADYLKIRWPAALCEVGKKVAEGRVPDYVALRHLSRADRKAVLDGMGVAFEHSASLAEWGCHGTNDPILSLDLGLKSGAVRNGAYVAMVSGGIGFTYAAALIRWGDTTL